jgi:hypothetical protein
MRNRMDMMIKRGQGKGNNSNDEKESTAEIVCNFHYRHHQREDDLENKRG